LREFGFAGEHKAFQEVLMEGPAPGGLSPDEWLAVRSRFLAETYDIELEICQKDLREQEAWLGKSSEDDETILWFEHDLFCQIHLIYLLDWFAKQPKGPARLSLICVDEFPGVEDFRGLGQLTGEQLASLFDKRHEVTDPEFRLAGKAWAAYYSTNPREIERLIAGDTSALPFLAQALRLHLMRFPSVKNGLGRIEQTALEMISSEAIAFKSLFPRFAKAHPIYGLGDSQFWSALKRLNAGNNPLIKITEPATHQNEHDSNRYHDASLEITGAGRAVLAAERDLIEDNGIDLWLGGVHLHNESIWRWDESTGLIAQRRA
jgi:hypothetical protein